MPNEPSHDSCPACGPWWRFPLLLAVVLAAILLVNARQGREPTPEAAPPAASRSKLAEAPYRVSVTIDFGDQRVLRNRVPWWAGMTVRDLLSSASLGTGEVGRGESAFLVSIDGVKNEGAGGRNWIYSVNGKHADRSFAVYELQPDDNVLWTFTKQQ